MLHSSRSFAAKGRMGADRPLGMVRAPALPMGLRSPYLAPPRPKPRGRSGGSGEGSGLRDPRMARVEAVLFLADEPLNTRKISQLANLADGTEARTLIRRLNDFYDRQGTAFRAEETAGGFQLLTRRKFAGWLRRLVKTHVETRLSAPALETLAVAAYRQPVTRLEVESIRGVQCDEMLRQLMDRDLVKIVGRSDDLGRPFLYGTTKRFLRFFGLRHLDDLPRAAELRATGAAENAAANDTNQADLSLVNDSIEEPEVKIATKTELTRDDEATRRRLSWLDEARAEDDTDEDEDEDEDEDDDDEEDDEEDDDDDEEEDEDFDDEDFDDDWEEVDDEDEEEDEDDEDWDEDDEDDDDDDEDEDEEEDDE